MSIEHSHDEYVELAKNLCAAYMSYKLDLSISHALKYWVERVNAGEEIDEYWIQLARNVIDDMDIRQEHSI